MCRVLIIKLNSSLSSLEIVFRAPTCSSSSVVCSSRLSDAGGRTNQAFIGSAESFSPLSWESRWRQPRGGVSDTSSSSEDEAATPSPYPIVPTIRSDSELLAIWGLISRPDGRSIRSLWLEFSRRHGPPSRNWLAWLYGGSVHLVPLPGDETRDASLAGARVRDRAVKLARERRRASFEGSPSPSGGVTARGTVRATLAQQRRHHPTIHPLWLPVPGWRDRAPVRLPDQWWPYHVRRAPPPSGVLRREMGIDGPESSVCDARKTATQNVIINMMHGLVSAFTADMLLGTSGTSLYDRYETDPGAQWAEFESTLRCRSSLGSSTTRPARTSKTSSTRCGSGASR